MKTLTAFTLGAAMLAPALFGQTAYTEGTIHIPGAAVNSVVPSGIDADNQFVGSFSDGSTYHGFLFTGGVLAQVDDPADAATFAQNINGKRGIVGAVSAAGAGTGMVDGGDRFRLVSTRAHAGQAIFAINDSGTMIEKDSKGVFEVVQGIYTLIEPDFCDPTQNDHMYVTGNNKHGDLVGQCENVTDGNQTGFARIGGVYQAIDFPGSLITIPTGINDSGTIAGVYQPDQLHAHGFLLSGGVYRTWDLSVANASFTWIRGINNRGSLVGTFIDTSTNQVEGFYALAN